MKPKLPRRRAWLAGLVLLGAAALAAAQEGGAALSLEDTLKNLDSGGGAALRWEPFFQGGVLTSSGHQAAFQAGAPGERGPVLVDNRDILVLPAPYLEGGQLRFPRDFVTAVAAMLRPQPSPGTEAAGTPEAEARAPTVVETTPPRERIRIAAIVVDPGHGGRDPGTIGEHTIKEKKVRLVEKELTLKVARDLHRQLSAAYPDKRVLLTREGDTYPTLEDRVALAHSVPLGENEAIVFISIHANASYNKSARGFEVWYLSPEYRRNVLDPAKYAHRAENGPEVISILNDMMEEELTTESIMLARFILNEFDQTMGSLIPSRGIKDKDWFVVRKARMPSVLVELGFVTNREDAMVMMEPEMQRRMAESLYRGITAFITMFEETGGFT